MLVERPAAGPDRLTGVTPEVVGRRDGDGQLHRLVGAVQRGPIELAEHPLAGVDRQRQVAGLAVAAAERERRLDPRDRRQPRLGDGAGLARDGPAAEQVLEL